jgi:hypothetical protein
LGGPYPNPITTGPINLSVLVPGTATVKWSVFTLAFRKIVGGQTTITTQGLIQWDLKDKSGVRVADGVYYLRVEVDGIQSVVKIFKILVLR